VVCVTRLSTENCRFGDPKKSARIVDMAPVAQPCAEGYSGCAGVIASGDQFGSVLSGGMLSPG
jgi:hypothetical protein